MAEPVNLNRFKKQKARAEKKARADQNAIFHGLSKSDKTVAKKLTELDQKKLDALKKSNDT